MNRVILSKAQNIDRCLKQIREYYAENEINFRNSYLHQDAILLNLQRACELSIDLANHVTKKQNWGIPQKAADSFGILLQNKLIDKNLCQKMVSLVGFRNIAVHDYTSLNLDIVVKIIEKHLVDIEIFVQKILAFDYEK